MAEGRAERSSAHSKDVRTFKISGWRERAHGWEVTNRKQLGVGVGACPSGGPTGHGQGLAEDPRWVWPGRRPGQGTDLDFFTESSPYTPLSLREAALWLGQIFTSRSLFEAPQITRIWK